jgi:hypothetical protein
MANDTAIKTRLIQVRLAVQRSNFLAGIHAFARPRLTLISIAAIARLGIPIRAARL